MFTVKTLAVCVVAVAALVAYRKVSRRSESMSLRWLNEQEQQAMKKANQIDGVSWKWPIRKSVNESAAFNTRRLRKRA